MHELGRQVGAVFPVPVQNVTHHRRVEPGRRHVAPVLVLKTRAVLAAIAQEEHERDYQQHGGKPDADDHDDVSQERLASALGVGLVGPLRLLVHYRGQRGAVFYARGRHVGRPLCGKSRAQLRELAGRHDRAGARHGRIAHENACVQRAVAPGAHVVASNRLRAGRRGQVHGQVHVRQRDLFARAHELPVQLGYVAVAHKRVLVAVVPGDRRFSVAEVREGVDGRFFLVNCIRGACRASLVAPLHVEIHAGQLRARAVRTCHGHLGDLAGTVVGRGEHAAHEGKIAGEGVAARLDHRQRAVCAERRVDRARVHVVAFGLGGCRHAQKSGAGAQEQAGKEKGDGEAGCRHASGVDVASHGHVSGDGITGCQRAPMRECGAVGEEVHLESPLSQKSGTRPRTAPWARPARLPRRRTARAPRSGTGRQRGYPGRSGWRCCSS